MIISTTQGLLGLFSGSLVGFSLGALMDEVEALVRILLGSAHGARRGERLSYRAAFARELSLDPFTAPDATLLEAARHHGLESGGTNRDELLEFLMGVGVGPRLGRGALSFIHGYPATQAALARLDPKDPRAALRFELYCEGVELANGYSEGIALDVNGYLSEGSGENLFVVRGSTIYTTPLANSVLSGITRDSVLTLARHLGITVVEQPLPREILYIADEVFFTGTAAEVTPIRSVDRILVKDGTTGPITHQLAEEFFGIVSGTRPDRYNWLTPVNVRAAEPVGA